ncbi:hypothetical protein DSO57_1038405 [Entomophthora muscae]|uniref:Uncharacterized protein n=1 Tax=Entomophthora muscae TaxID=34485 RepID=A0ACC2S0S7_9FUNG|nr:hypothetical protein DSO57_1038405 [Entomophthora muscae]
MDAPLSTLKKHLRVKHGFGIRNPPSTMPSDNFVYFIPDQPHRRMDIESLLNPEATDQPNFRLNNCSFVDYRVIKCPSPSN